MTATIVHPTKPFADGICFDDLDGMSIKACNVLASRGLVFCTEFRVPNRVMAGNIVAADLRRALDVAASRGLGEKIVGRLIETGTTYGNRVEAVTRQEIQAAMALAA